jgi:hypothetical protein
MKKYNKDIQLTSYKDVFNWLVSCDATKQNPISIEKYGGQSPRPFRTHIEGGDIILRSNPLDSIQRRYILTREKWDSFCHYVTAHPDMCRGELANNYRQYECTNKYFWPSIISICKRYHNN